MSKSSPTVAFNFLRENNRHISVRRTVRHGIVPDLNKNVL